EEEAPTIVDLERKRYDAELVLIEPLDWIKAARVRLGYTDYMHVESEGDHATRYDNEGWELRGEIAHDSFASFDQGTVGIQLADNDFSAIGEEAFTPGSNTQSQAIFMSEQIHNGDLHWEFGARVENQTVDHSANPTERPDIDGSSYSDTALGLGVSAIWNFAENQSLTLSLQRSQRHPSHTELYALGAHIATDQYEIGDPNLGLETAYGIDLRHNYSEGNWSTAVSAFYTAFDDYIYSRNLGTQTTITNDEVGSPHFGESVDYDNYRFEAVDAIFWGFEAEANYIAYQSEGNTVTVGLLADYVRATNEDDNTNLPRITPMRIGGKLRIENGPWAVGALLRQNFKQSKTADYENETASFTELQIDLLHSIELEGGELTLFAQGRNLLDEDIRRHTSFIKDKAPLPGSSVNVGLSYKF
ncbi:MAG: TonB-dependent receptor, partial [Verrucomicrobiota bacterium]|nr:TonB-dependent receptor [Verrucomicrobiota bacterium]